MLAVCRYAHLVAALAALCASASAWAADDTAIKSIIPHDRVGRETCFEGRFSGKAVDMTAWPSYAEQATYARAASDAKAPGKDRPPAQRPSTRALPQQGVSHVALHLAFTKGREANNESWDMEFTVKVTSPAIGQELYARSGCTWSGWDAKTEREIEPEFMLACWIECDGGSMRAVRVPGTASLDLYFSRFFMQSGCEGGGRFSVADGEASQKIAFRLEKAPLKACRALKAWDRMLRHLETGGADRLPRDARSHSPGLPRGEKWQKLGGVDEATGPRP
jgi:hypothetical protein